MIWKGKILNLHGEKKSANIIQGVPVLKVHIYIFEFEKKME